MKIESIVFNNKFDACGFTVWKQWTCDVSCTNKRELKEEGGTR